MASLDELIKKLEANNATRYTPLTADQIKQQATTRYEGAYGQKKLSAQQQYDLSDQALAQQLAGLDDQYKKQLEQSAKNYEDAYRTADRQSLGRGMQRSSYNSATLANINLKGAEAQQAIRDTQAAQAKNIGEQRALLKTQLGDTLANLDAAQQSDILAYIDELEAREYDRLRDDTAMQNEIAMNLYQYQHQKEQSDLTQKNWQAQMDYQKAQDALAQQNWQTQFDYQKAQDALAQENWLKTFNAQYGGGDAGGGYGGGGSQNSNRYNDFMNGMNGDSGKTKVTNFSVLPDVAANSAVVKPSVYAAVNNAPAVAAKQAVTNPFPTLAKKQETYTANSVLKKKR